MYNQLGTPASLKRKVAFPNVGEHVIASHLTSTDLAGVERETKIFMQDVLKLQPVAATPLALATEARK